MILDLEKAQKILLKNARYLAEKKLKFITDADRAVTTEDFISEIFTAGYHATCHLYYEEGKEPKHAINYGKVAMENFTYNIIRNNTTQKKNLYITETNNYGEKVFIQKKVSMSKIEEYVSTGDRDFEETMIQKELLEVLMQCLKEYDAEEIEEEKYSEIFRQFMDNGMMSLKRIAVENGSSTYKVRKVIARILKQEGFYKSRLKVQESH